MPANTLQDKNLIISALVIDARLPNIDIDPQIED